MYTLFMVMTNFYIFEEINTGTRIKVLFNRKVKDHVAESIDTPSPRGQVLRDQPDDLEGPVDFVMCASETIKENILHTVFWGGLLE